MSYTNRFNKVRGFRGVAEWASWSYNIGIGCHHGCLYCYSCSFFVQEQMVANYDAWLIEHPKPNKVNINQYEDKRVMMPSTHDISPRYLNVFCQALNNVLVAGNNVLIVSKPHFECIEHICREFQAFKSQIEFRFSISSLDPAVTGFWEPFAPLPEERMRCLVYAGEQGCQTSVSMEPILEGKDQAIDTFNQLKQLTDGTIWIGRMNGIDQRVICNNQEIAAAVQRIKNLQSDSEMRMLHSLLCHEPQVRWKDSISELVR